MNIILNYASGPLIGAIIGYITNYIAIKMLFRPYNPVYVFGKRLAFTPGIIPRRKDMIAAALGKAVFDKFFNWDDLETVFLSDTFADKVTEKIVLSVKREKYVGEFLDKLPSETGDLIADALYDRILSKTINNKLINRLIIDAAQSESGTSGSGKFMSSIAASYSGPIAEKIEDYFKKNGREILSNILISEKQDLENIKIADFLQKINKGKSVDLNAEIKKIYMNFMKKNVGSIVKSIDIVTQITTKMNEMSAAEVESLVLDIVSKELNLVVLFGAVLGAIIGTVNIFI